MINWSALKCNAPVEVKLNSGAWVKRHFAKYENGLVYVWDIGRTSWTSGNDFSYSEPHAPEYVKVHEKG